MIEIRELFNNPDLIPSNSTGLQKQAGLNSFTVTLKNIIVV